MKSSAGSLALAKIILDQVPLHPQYLLDIGCGNGELTALLAKKADSILAIDWDNRAITEARSKFAGQKRIIFRVGNAEHLDEVVDDLTFDCITSVLTLHHVDLMRSLEDMKRHLTRNGRIIIVDLFAEKKSSFFSLLLDQVFFSHLREISALLRTIKDIGTINVLSFLLWRLEFAVSAEGRQHMYRDFLRGTPYSTQQLRNIFQEVLPGGKERILMGSVFMYSWEHINNKL